MFCVVRSNLGRRKIARTILFCAFLTFLRLFGTEHNYLSTDPLSRQHKPTDPRETIADMSETVMERSYMASASFWLFLTPSPCQQLSAFSNPPYDVSICITSVLPSGRVQTRLRQYGPTRELTHSRQYSPTSDITDLVETEQAQLRQYSPTSDMTDLVETEQTHLRQYSPTSDMTDLVETEQTQLRQYSPTSDMTDLVETEQTHLRQYSPTSDMTDLVETV